MAFWLALRVAMFSALSWQAAMVAANGRVQSAG